MNPSIKNLRLSVASSDSRDGSVVEDESCGIEFGCGSLNKKRFLLPSLQRFATTKWALCFFSLGGFIQGFLVNGHTSSIISTLEKRFGLSSTESGLIASCYEIAGTLVVLFVTYVGGRGHKPLWVAWGIFLIGLSGVIFSLPHFIASRYSFTKTSHVCGDLLESSCQQKELKSFRFLFYGAMLIAGVGSTPLYSLGVTFLDENVKQRYSALYNGIFVMLSIIGPGIGYLAGGVFLSVYTNPSDEVSITESDNQWIGAWWLGSLIFGIIGIILSLPTFLLPRVIPGTEKNRVGRGKEVHATDNGNENVDFGKSFKDFPKCVYILFRNPTYLFITLGITIDSLLIGGTAVFGPKFIEVQFGIDSSTAGTYFGLMAILGGAGGQLIGGALLSKLDVKIRWMLHISYLSPLLCVFFSFCFLITCADQPFAGIVSPYHTDLSANNFTLSSHCNFNCNCSETDFFPVCGSDKTTYFSPCFAGCTNQSEIGLYTNCSCVSPSGNGSLFETATNGVCINDECSSGWRIIIFCICLFGIMFFTFFNEAAALQVSLRCVAFNRRSFSIGLQILLLRAFGTLPGPLVVGAILDGVCTRWSDDCGAQGSCLAYDNKKLALYLFLFICLGKLLDFALFLGGLISYKPLQEEEKKENQTLQGSNGTQAKSQNIQIENNEQIISNSSNPKETKSKKKTNSLSFFNKNFKEAG